MSSTLKEQANATYKYESAGGEKEEMAKGAVQYLDSSEILGADEEKRLVRKIDTRLLGLLIVSYGLQYLDKTSLAYSAVLGLPKDLHLKGQNFSWVSSIFYVGYLAATYPISLAFIKFPLGKFISVVVFVWGAVLCFHALANNWASLMVLRTLLGAMESPISPGFSLITGMWYTPKEHGNRHAFWFCGNSLASIIGSFIAYGTTFYDGPVLAWRVLFITFGLITVAWSVVLWFFLPDSPATAKFLTASERQFAALRPKKHQRTTQTRKFNRAQFIETLKDPKSWWFLVFTFAISVPIGGSVSFQTLIIKGFGYDQRQTILMGIPASVFQFVAVVIATIVISKFPRSRLNFVVGIFLVAMAGALMIKLLPTSEKLSRLAGFWFVTSVAPTFPIMLSLYASNTAGFTKKSTVSVFIFAGYCAGFIAGPQFFKDSEAPHYQTAYIEILVVYACVIALCVGMRIYLLVENKRRDREQGVHIDPEARSDVDLLAHEGLADVDETDLENRSFRYIV